MRPIVLTAVIPVLWDIKAENFKFKPRQDWKQHTPLAIMKKSHLLPRIIFKLRLLKKIIKFEKRSNFILYGHNKHYFYVTVILGYGFTSNLQLYNLVQYIQRVFSAFTEWALMWNSSGIHLFPYFLNTGWARQEEQDSASWWDLPVQAGHPTFQGSVYPKLVRYYTNVYKL